MKIFGILILVVLYLLMGVLILSMYSLVKDYDIPFSKDNDDETSAKQMLVWSFWPFYLLYLIIYCIAWYINKMCFSIKYILNKFKNS